MGKSRGYCDTHRWQLNKYGETWDAGSRRPSLSEAQVDGSLLLIARGASTDEVAAVMGIASGKALTGHLRKRAAAGLRDALSARLATPHGTLSRYQRRGCRCSDCRRANREAKRPPQIEPETLTLRSRSSTPDEWVWRQRRREASVRSDLLDRADHRYQQWTGPEIETALARTPDGARFLRSAPEVARLTRRTVGGVWYIRRKADEPKTLAHL